MNLKFRKRQIASNARVFDVAVCMTGGSPIKHCRQAGRSHLEGCQLATDVSTGCRINFCCCTTICFLWATAQTAE
jgi:hypothetical protein